MAAESHGRATRTAPKTFPSSIVDYYYWCCCCSQLLSPLSGHERTLRPPSCPSPSPRCMDLHDFNWEQFEANAPSTVSCCFSRRNDTGNGSDTRPEIGVFLGLGTVTIWLVECGVVNWLLIEGCCSAVGFPCSDVLPEIL